MTFLGWIYVNLNLFIRYINSVRAYWNHVAQHSNDLTWNGEKWSSDNIKRESSPFNPGRRKRRHTESDESDSYSKELEEVRKTRENARKKRIKAEENPKEKYDPKEGSSKQTEDEENEVEIIGVKKVEKAEPEMICKWYYYNEKKIGLYL